MCSRLVKVLNHEYNTNRREFLEPLLCLPTPLFVRRFAFHAGVGSCETRRVLIINRFWPSHCFQEFFNLQRFPSFLSRIRSAKLLRGSVRKTQRARSRRAATE